jgi:cellulose synthase/poly-beta-1,6-N-acetylglucosamine synthase-like glycosyltransferase
MSYPIISIIIPCRNEEKYIGKCLDSIIDNDYPNENLEILVADGMSDDATRNIIGGYCVRYPFIKLLDNMKRITPTALNIGIGEAKGEIVIRMDAHNIYEKDYISKCVWHLKEHNVDNVGGVCVTLPGADTTVAESIAFVLSHPFGIGNSYFRIGSKELRYVDTVPFGCYRKEVFEEVGLFNEDFIRNQDDELNHRLIKKGGKIILAPDIVSHYYARESLRKLWKMYFQYGYFKPFVARKVGGVLTLRQLVPAALVGSLTISALLSFMTPKALFIFLLILSLYLVANLACSFSLALKKGLKYFFVLPVVFATTHFSYGFGYFKGIWDFILSSSYKKKKIRDIPITR